MKLLSFILTVLLPVISCFGQDGHLFNPGSFIFLPTDDNSQTKKALAFLQEEIGKDFHITSPVLNPQTGLPDSTLIKTVTAKYLKRSMDNLDTDPDEYIRCMINAGVAEKIVGNKIGLAFSRQNVGFIYEEKLGRTDTALFFINSSLDLWNEINDTLQRANLYKYRGYLWGLTKNFEEGLKDIDTAYVLYTGKGYEPGIAVTENNLADIYYEMGNMDSALFYYKKALGFWKKNDVAARIFQINTKIINMLRNRDIVAAYVKENDLMLQNEHVLANDKKQYEELKRSIFQD